MPPTTSCGHTWILNDPLDCVQSEPASVDNNNTILCLGVRAILTSEVREAETKPAYTIW